MDLAPEKLNTILLCRICLTLLKDKYLEITSTTFEEKTLIQLMELIGEVTIEPLESQPRNVCIPCSQNLCKFYLFRKQIQKTEANFKRKFLTLVQIGDKTKFCFTENNVQIERLVVVSKEDAEIEESVEEIKTELEDVSEAQKSDLGECKSEVKQDVEVVGDGLENSAEGLEEKVGTAVKCLIYPCIFCDIKFATINQLCRHYKYRHSDKKPTFPCEQCGKSFSSGQCLRNHQIRLHSTVRPFPCQYCEKAFATAFHFKRHIQQKHAGASTENFDEMIKSVKLLRRHHEQHPQLHTCPVCDKKFLKMNYLTKHMLMHEGKRFACDQCDRICRLKSQLIKHKKKMHSSERPFLCDTCGKSYALQLDLKRHVATHSTEKPFLCEVCSRQFPSRYHLIDHRRIHKKRKLIPCKVCGKEFNERYIALHMQVHDPTKFKCEICDKEFNIYKSLYDHKRKVHFRILEKASSCDICGVTFAVRSYLIRHKMSVHMGIRYKCTVCGVVYSSKSKARIHVKRLHADRAADKSVIVKIKLGDASEKSVVETGNEECELGS